MIDCALQFIDFGKGLTVSQVRKLLDCIGVSENWGCLPVDVETDVGCAAGFILRDAAEDADYCHVGVIKPVFERIITDNRIQPDETGAIQTEIHARNVFNEKVDLNVTLFL